MEALDEEFIDAFYWLWYEIVYISYSLLIYSLKNKANYGRFQRW